jgi:hypothetical protein
VRLGDRGHGLRGRENLSRCQFRSESPQLFTELLLPHGLSSKLAGVGVQDCCLRTLKGDSQLAHQADSPLKQFVNRGGILIHAGDPV